VHGRTNATGARLVRHPAIAAVGFTGSLAGGRALCDLAAARPAPIPVFAEMGSANPVFVLPGALAQDPAGVAQKLAASATLASGQFCTCPGLVLWREGEGAVEFRSRLAAAFAAVAPGPMVHETVRAGYAKALAEVESLPVQVAARSPAAGPGAGAHAGAVLFAAEGRELLAHPRLREEMFGPAMLAVACRDASELRAVAESLHGHLTATVHGTEADFAAHRDLVAILQRKAGRIVVNGVPTGVEVCPAMVHGGPWPASSDARFSAVGTSSILRWARPVCFQDAPRSLLPDALLDENPSGLMRTVDGVLARH
jgi:NADP-dependent aldehyde dehydrogenase